MKDLPGGKEVPYFGILGRAHFSRDGTVIGHGTKGPEWRVYLTSTNGGIDEKLCEHCGTYWHWSSDRKKIIYVLGDRAFLEVLDLPSGKRPKFLPDQEFDVYAYLLAGRSMDSIHNTKRYCTNQGLRGPVFGYHGNPSSGLYPNYGRLVLGGCSGLVP